jgi:N-methylhydantoinase B
VRSDVVDGYVSIDRARKDYGVVLRVDPEDPDLVEVEDVGTAAERRRLRVGRFRALQTRPREIAERYVDGQLTAYDLVRQFGVIVDWGSGHLLEKTTDKFREILQERCVRYWPRIEK